jgi:DNA-binding response OmpR family regulator
MEGQNMSKAKKRILIADDDWSILEVLEMILEDEGYEVEKTLDGDKIYNLTTHLPDLLLLDIWMSGIDGRDICRYVKAHDRLKNIPIIMVSANKDTEHIALEVGADDFLAKPFDIDDLLTKVRKYV